MQLVREAIDNLKRQGAAAKAAGQDAVQVQQAMRRHVWQAAEAGGVNARCADDYRGNWVAELVFLLDADADVDKAIQPQKDVVQARLPASALCSHELGPLVRNGCVGDSLCMGQVN